MNKIYDKRNKTAINDTSLQFRVNKIDGFAVCLLSF